ncbi:MAG TPA: EAL domain-containing protein [Ilumatobacter sp.]|nr:EAL domain-containing protein [Ilumatobacter sp.]
MNAPTDSQPNMIDHESGALAALRELLHASDAATLVIGLDGTMIDANPAGRSLFRPPDHTHPGGRLPLNDVIDQIPAAVLAGADGGSWRGQINLATPSEPGATYEVTVVVRHDPTTVQQGFMAVLCRDITDQVTRTEHLQQQLRHDAATGLLTRTAALGSLATSLAAGRVDLAVLMVDIDGMGDVNDSLGHRIGDRVILAAAHRLTTAVRPDDIVARVGGDEFAVLCHGLTSADAADELADRVRQVLMGRLTVQQIDVDLSVSIGVAMLDPQTTRELDPRSCREASEQLLSDADAALHAAKRRGRSNTAVASPHLRAEARDRTQLASDLARGFRQGELRVEYQPIFSAVTEKPVAAEALMRWEHPTRGRLEAGQFVRAAEETGTIGPIGDWVLEQALAAAQGWMNDGTVNDRFSVHVNVSRQQLSSPTFVTRVTDLLREHSMRPRQLVIEAREATLLGDAHDAIRTVRSLRRVGVRVALDNFGTGSDALSLMTEVGADLLKLDGSLALPTGSSEADTRVVRSLVMLAHALDMEVVAERVTGVEQLRRLRSAGCDYVQGHLVGMPSPPDRFRPPAL